MKTAEELKKQAKRMSAETWHSAIKHVIYSFDERELQEYAELWHKAKLEEVTDEDIEKHFFGYGWFLYDKKSLKRGAKAMRNGEIKHT